MKRGVIEQVVCDDEDQPKSAFVADFIGESNFIEVEVGAGGKAALDNGRRGSGPGSRAAGRQR